MGGSFRSRLAALLGRKPDTFSGAGWIPAAENPFGVELLDCRRFSQGMTATTGDREVAESFLRLRGSDGGEHRGRSPEDAGCCECDLRYPQVQMPDGPLFKAEEMEDKWDIYRFDGHLYFARSWTGKLMYRARIELSGSETVVTVVEAPRALLEQDPPYLVQVVDYLMRSHVDRQLVPHPLPPSLGRDPNQLALFSFSQYGRRALFGTFADTTRLGLPKDDEAGEHDA